MSPIPYTVLENTETYINEALQSTPRQRYEDHDVEFLDRTSKSHWFEDSAIEGLTTIRKVVSEFLDDPPDLTASVEPREQMMIRSIGEAEVEARVGRWLVLMVANTVFAVSNADPDVSKAHRSKKMREKIETGEHPPDPVRVYQVELEESRAKLVDLWNEVYRTNAPGGSEQSVTVDGSENATIYSYSDNWVPLDENPAHQAETDVRLGDARTFDFPEYYEEVDLAITSPPYINAMNYYRGTKLRLFWIQDLLEETTAIDADTLRRSIIGSNATNIRGFVDELPKYLRNDWKGSREAYQETSLPELDEDIKAIHTGSLSEATQRAYVTYKFFAEDMLKTLTQVYRHLKPGACFYFVIGENTIGGRRIESHRFVADIAQNIGQFSGQPDDIGVKDGYHFGGFAWDGITRRDLFQDRDHGNGAIEREWVVFLQKPA